MIARADCGMRKKIIKMSKLNVQISIKKRKSHKGVFFLDIGC
jgi:hypothetical protein